MNLAVSLLLVALAAVLLGAAAAKTFAAWRGRLTWPDPTLAGVPIPSGVVIVVEAVAAGSVVAVPAPRSAAAVLAVAYAVLSFAAIRLRGRTCACFGVSSSVVGPGHIAGTAAACLAACVIAVAAPGWGLPVGVRAATLVVIAAAAVIGPVIRNSRRTARARAAEAAAVDPARLVSATGIVVLTQAECPRCAALHVLLDGMIDDRLIQFIDHDADADLPEHIVSGRHSWADYVAAHRELARDAFPCAVAVDPAGRPVGRPRWGILHITRLVETYLQARTLQPVSR
ncbi:hypothetical protein [Nocardia pseudobrasiliensis]|uniref:Methylamine utilization protein MauE n=1 Tax=Nocardia pseudobrasiliensis TaxID=45979 RepID=A0A370I233_9NOCA|nr:hypothetical protein [Nocardia pseudobrasiliensis]RDI64795.1 hypothetical protein DFR76_107171 [Nocardia pseudobrasiliensis]